MKGQLNLHSPLLEEDEGLTMRPVSNEQPTNAHQTVPEERRNSAQGAAGGSDVTNELRIDEDVADSTKTNNVNQSTAEGKSL